MSEEKKKGGLFSNLPFVKKLKKIKHIEVIVCIIFIALLLLIYFWGFTNVKDKTDNKETITEEGILYTSSTAYAQYLEQKLESVISCMKGVGKVKVIINVSNNSKVIVAEEVTEETVVSSGGETTVTVVSTPIIVTENGENKPIVIGEVLPVVEGVVVVAGGADDTFIKLNIYQIIQAIADVSSDNIQVFAGN